MLTARRQLDSAKVLARDCTNQEAPFVCPRCDRELILRKGRIKVHHFAHKPPVTCSFGAGETEQHHRAKLEILDALRTEAHVTELEVERDFGISVADVFAKISGVSVAIEIQRSALTVNDITSRTENYHRLGIAVLWLGLPASLPVAQKYSPKAWGKMVPCCVLRSSLLLEPWPSHTAGSPRGVPHTCGSHQLVRRRVRTKCGRLRQAVQALAHTQPWRSNAPLASLHLASTPILGWRHSVSPIVHLVY